MLVDNGWNITCSPDIAQQDPAKARELMADKYAPGSCAPP